MSHDAILVRQTLNGNASAFEELVERHSAAALALAMQYAHNFHDAQDITQEALCSAYINLPNLTEPSRFRPWLLQIAANHARMWARKQSRRAQREEAIAEDWTDAPVEYERFADSLAWCDVIGKAMEALTPSDRAITTLYFFDDHLCREVAEVLSLPVGTVKRRLHQIRKVLRKEVRTMLNEKGSLKHRVGIETSGGVFTTILDKDTELPSQKTLTFTTAKDKQHEIYIHLVEGDGDFVSDCQSLGEILLRDFTIAPKGSPQIAVTLSIDADGTLSIDAVENPQGSSVAVEAKTAVGTVSVRTV